MSESFERLGKQLRHRRRNLQLSQPQLARRVGRQPSRISELERDLLNRRMGKDRLTLLSDLCDALGMRIELVPIGMPAQTSPAPPPHGRAFDELFVDLSDED